MILNRIVRKKKARFAKRMAELAAMQYAAVKAQLNSGDDPYTGDE